MHHHQACKQLTSCSYRAAHTGQVARKGKEEEEEEEEEEGTGGEKGGGGGGERLPSCQAACDITPRKEDSTQEWSLGGENNNFSECSILVKAIL